MLEIVHLRVTFASLWISIASGNRSGKSGAKTFSLLFEQAHAMDDLKKPIHWIELLNLE